MSSLVDVSGEGSADSGAAADTHEQNMTAPLDHAFRAVTKSFSINAGGEKVSGRNIRIVRAQPFRDTRMIL
jgi:hypothetical protein